MPWDHIGGGPAEIVLSNSHVQYMRVPRQVVESSHIRAFPNVNFYTFDSKLGRGIANTELPIECVGAKEILLK